MSLETRANPLIYVLVVWFASSAWLGNFGAFIENSIFIQVLPEGWNLPSVLTISIQTAGIIPWIYIIVDRIWKIPIRHGVVIQAAIVVAALVQIPMIFGWNWTAVMFGKEHSYVLIGYICVSGAIAIGSTVVFLPFMMTFDPVYLPAYFLGGGVAALFPSILSMIQGTSTYQCVANATGQLEPHYAPPRFSVNVFYVFMFVWMVGAAVAFYLINNHLKRLKRVSSCGNREDRCGMLDKEANARAQVPAEEAPAKPVAAKKPSKLADLAILACVGMAGAQMNTILPNVQSFASIPYSHTTYFWTIIAGTLVPLAGPFAADFFAIRRTSTVVLLSAVCAIGTAFVVLLALQSPNPWLKGSFWGSALTITLQTFCAFMYAFLQTLGSQVYRDSDPTNEDRLFWVGVALQVGSLIGTCVVYPSVNYLDLFHPAPAC
ncbi:Riboflavin transporter [Aphelenchoides fujianensis]|nr:Riboflavin transporter [Aphelenchoides fujianensis]